MIIQEFVNNKVLGQQQKHAQQKNIHLTHHDDVNDIKTKRDGNQKQFHPPNSTHRHTSWTMNPQVPRQHHQEGTRRNRDIAARTNKLILRFPSTLIGEWRWGNHNTL
jgi:hypothetical protein